MAEQTISNLLCSIKEELSIIRKSIETKNVFVEEEKKDAWGGITNISLAELAARTSSPLKFDRRGDLIFYDNYEDQTLKFGIDISGFGAVTHSSETAKYGNRSIKLVTGFSNADSTGISYYHMDFHDYSKVGAQISFATAETGYVAIDFQLIYYDGANKHTAQIKWIPGTNTLQYLDSSGNYKTLAANLKYYAHKQAWSTLKLVVDLGSDYKKYVRVLFMGREFDLSGAKIQSAADTSARNLNIRFYATTNENAGKIVYIDDYILTENE